MPGQYMGNVGAGKSIRCYINRIWPKYSYHFATYVRANLEFDFDSTAVVFFLFDGKKVLESSSSVFYIVTQSFHYSLS